MNQIKNSFDSVTLEKIGKSALLLLAGTFLAFVSDNLVQLLTATGMTKDQLGFAIVLFTLLINTAREYLKGTK